MKQFAVTIDLIESGTKAKIFSAEKDARAYFDRLCAARWSGRWVKIGDQREQIEEVKLLEVSDANVREAHQKAINADGRLMETSELDFEYDPVTGRFV